MDWRWAIDKPLCEHEKNIHWNEKNQGTSADNLMSLVAYISLRIRTICPNDICKFWALFQYLIRLLITKSCEVSEPGDLYLDLSYRFEIRQTPWQHCCRGAALLLRCLLNFKMMRQFKVPISWRQGFTRSYDKTCYQILKQGPGGKMLQDISMI